MSTLHFFMYLFVRLMCVSQSVALTLASLGASVFLKNELCP